MNNINEVINTNQALVASENRYRRLFEAAQDGILILNADTGEIEDVNPFMIEMLGYSHTEFLGKELWEIGLFSDINANKEAFLKLKEEGYLRYKDLPLKTKNGNAISVEFVSNRYDVSVGQVIQCNIRNITERKIAEENNMLLAERLRLATSSAVMGIWFWDIKNDNMVWDEKLYQIYDTNELKLGSVHEGWLSRLHPEDKDKVNEVMQSAIRDKKREYSSEFRIIWDDLSVHYIKGTGIAEYDDNGNVIQMMGVNWDVTVEKEKEQHLKLLESVITNTTDTVLITEAEPFDEPGPRILYVNDAFTKMTGYTAEEVIGKTPRILQGPKSDMIELKRLGEAIRRWETCEITTINYKKNGEEFWINFTLTPVANEKGWYTHWIAIERDVTIRKNEELQNELIANISNIFSEPLKLNETLDKTLRYIAKFGDFCLAEAWLTSSDQNKLNKISSHAATENVRLFLEETNSVDTFIYGEGLPGIVAKTKEIIIWGNLENQKLFLRRDAALKYSIKKVIGFPLLHNKEVIGVLAFGLNREVIDTATYLSLFKKLGDYLGPEIKRKRLEIELNQMFNFAPDLIVIIGLDGCFKRVNPATCQLLGYTQEEVCTIPYSNFIHPEDREKSTNEIAMLLETNLAYYFENRYITKSGKIKWLAWNAIYVNEDNNIYAVAKDITDKKELEDLLQKVNELARIGVWEVDLQNNTIFWSDITKEIHEVAQDYIPDLKTGIAFFKKGRNRTKITEYVEQAINTGKPYDDEFQIVTAKGNDRWVRALGEAEFVNENCVRIYGSFQDIDQRKKLEIKLIENENNLILLNENLNKQKAALVTSNKELEQFAYVASHDLQEPLRMVTGFLTQLEKKYGDVIDDKGKKYIGFAVDGAKRMRQIILDLLEYSRIGTSEDEKEELDLNKLIDEIKLLLRKTIEEKEAIFIIDQLPKIHGYRSPMRQIFQNLINNALKYSKNEIPTDRKSVV